MSFESESKTSTESESESETSAAEPETATPKSSSRSKIKGGGNLIWIWLARAIAGLIGAGAGLTVGEVVAATSTRIPSLVIAISDSIIDSTLVPFWLRTWSIDQLGSAQKPVLVASVTVVALLAGALCGVFAKRLSWLPLVVFVIFGVLAGLSAADRPMSSAAWSGFSAGLATVIAISISYYLLSAVPDPARIVDEPLLVQKKLAQEDRRRFLVLTGATSVVFLLANVIGRAVARQVDSEASRVEVAAQLNQIRDPNSDATQGNQASGQGASGAQPPGTTGPPDAGEPSSTTEPPSTTSPAGTAAADLPPNLDDIEGISTLITPNNSFYRIDTALVVPRLTAESWRMSVAGMVDNPLELDFNQLLSYPLITETVTLSCVSNPIGGSLVGNAVWEGVRLADVLEDAGVQPGASQISGRSVDNWASGFPTELAYDGRVAMIAVAMNGDPLPVLHGFPARLVISGLYGYVSATKWLREIYLTTWEDFDSYWVPRGWSKRGPVKTQSRIDVPRGNDPRVPAGEVAVAGVAWAPHRSISRVEVQIDEEPWAEASLSRELASSSWRQWVYNWQATPGRHTIRVRATDGTGETQTSRRTSPAPNGASGWHTKSVRVEG